MEKLPLEFKGRGEVSGVLFTQLKRDGQICLYKRVEPEGFTSYEVIKAVEAKERDTIIGGVPVHFDAKEIYPTGNAWGATERACTSLQDAEKYFEIFVEREKQKEEV